MTGWYVTANDIKNWVATNKKEAETLLPELIRRLVLACDNNADVNFPSGDSVSNEGWDGIVKSEQGNKYIPKGSSGWEIGTDQSVKGKADSDFEKRTNKADPLNKNKDTFIFISPRHWAKKDHWVKEQLDKGLWTDVRGYNSESLANWIQDSPAVHRWFASVIGKRVTGIRDIDEAWSLFSNYTVKKLTTTFFLEGNTEATTKLHKDLIKTPKVTIQADSFIEAYGFVLSALLKDNDYSHRTLVIENQTAWDWAVSSGQSLILIPTSFTPHGIGNAIQRGHKIILYADQYNKDSAITLQRPSYNDRLKAIASLGFDETTSSSIYHDTKGYINPILRHELLEPRDILLPNWTTSYPTDVFFAALFATQWDMNNKNDREVLAKLSGMSYKDFEKHMFQLSKQQDPPIRLVGNIWQVISKVDFWFHINNQLTKEHFDRLHVAMTAVLSDLDPAFDLKADERYMANIHGAIPLYSGRLKTGIADTLTLLATLSDDYAKNIGGDTPPSHLIQWWVRELFEKNENLKFWYSLGSSMRSVAEAAPEQFLNALEKIINKEDSFIMGLFENGSDGTFNGCSHADLLWSLEKLAWNKKYLAQVAICLARLTEIDPGGTWSNRPHSSLHDIFLGWRNHTAASHTERLELLKNILVKSFPNITWDLLISLLPQSIGGMTSGTNKPDYRDWAQETNEIVTHQDYYQYGQGLIEILLEEAKNDPIKYGLDLFDQFDNLKKEQIGLVLKLFSDVNPKKIDQKERDNILNKIRRYVSWHDRKEKENDEILQFTLVELRKIYSHLNFSDPVIRHEYIFNSSPILIDHPEFKRKNSWKEQDKLIRQEQAVAISEIYTKKGINGITEIATNCDNPYMIGRFLEDVKSNFSENEPVIFDWISEDEALSTVARSYFSKEFYKEPRWGHRLLLEKSELGDKRKSILYSCFPTTKDTFDHLEKESPEINHEFWINFSQVYLDDKGCVPHVVKKLFDHNKPLTAIDCAASIFRGNDENLKQLDSQLIADVLTDIATNDKTDDNTSFQDVRYDVSSAIKILQARHDLQDTKISQIEWMYLRSFEYERGTPKFLYAALASEPSFFVQLITWLFKRSDGKEDKEKLPDNIAKQNIENAYTLLRKCSLLPGQNKNLIDTQVLSKYVIETRTLLDKAGRVRIGDSQLGQYLSHCPAGGDGIWPHEAVRDVIESIRSENFDNGFHTGKYNQRGVTTRSPFDGGDQEREIAKKYSNDSEKLQFSYPRTANILSGFASSYEHEAIRHDQDAELDV